MALGARLDRAQQSRPSVAFPLAVVYKFTEDQGGYLAALIAFYGFLSLFPLLLLLTTCLGFVLAGHPDLQEQVVSSALSQFPIIGDQLRNDVHALRGSAAAVAIGVFGSIWGSLGVARAVGNALDTVWAVPRRSRPNPFFARVRSFGLIGLLGLGVLLTTVLSAITTRASDLGTGLGVGLQVLAVVLGLIGNTGLVLVAFQLLTVKDVSFRQVLPGAAIAAVGWQLLQSAGTYLLQYQLQGRTQVYGLFALVLGLVTWLYLLAVVIVFAMEINTVRVGRLYPRALLTPFTDDVVLTDSDRRVYTAYAQAEQFKSFQKVDVSFDQDPPMELTHAMRTTGTCRRFRPDPVPDDVLVEAFDAARFGPQGGNRQPVRFVVVRDPERRAALAGLYRARWQLYLAALRERGLTPPPDTDHFVQHLGEVPVLIVVCVELAALHPTDTDLGRLSIVGGASVYPIVQNLCLALRGQGVASALTTLLVADEPAVAELLAIPPGYVTAAHLAVGYPEADFPRRLSRRPVAELVFEDTFGHPMGDSQ
ncbi:YihY family inner membrane protein [Parafrankia irregularis]|uniref:YihY family inner membrane protein n=1 Tax=Parafrankia irregularis TaxID=795642 RepID=A0A0S4QQI3_9ACTN|nr:MULTISPECIES: YhjD/YihY/BrkB family envelope integrity protein [Parafrankia]MBE3199829.1 YihY family inner membrane protein [Parafrankia sp. CH37]CUU57979.1 YihY family inner membrane protein [Parafrankia irregularis]